MPAHKESAPTFLGEPIYSLVETAKANHLRVYDYFEYILTELANHQDDTGREFLSDLMPWSEKAQEKCGHPKKS